MPRFPINYETPSTDLESRVGNVEAAVDAVETDVSSHESRLDAAETTITSHGGRLTTVEVTLDFLIDAVSSLPIQPVETPSGQFTAAINDDSLNVLLNAVIDFTADRYVVTLDDTITPTGMSGSPVTWAANAVKAFSTTLPNWNSHVVRFWARRTSDSLWIMLDPNPDNGDTVAGLDVQPKDITAPVAIEDFALYGGDDVEFTGLNPTSEFQYYFSATTDAGTGVGGYNLRDPSSQQIIVADATAGILTTVGGRTAGETIGLYVEAYDLASPANSSVSNTTSVTISQDTSSQGLVSFTNTLFEVSDDASPLTVTLQRTDGSSGTLAVDLSTRERYDYTTGEPIVKGGVAYEVDCDTKVSTANDTIDLQAAAPGWSNGQAVTYSQVADDSGNTENIGLVEATTYYVRDTATDVYTLHPTYDDAIANTSKLELTTGVTGETHILFEGANVGFEEISNETLSPAWSDSDSANKTFTVRVVKRQHPTNDTFQIDIDYGSNTNGAVVYPSSAICKINSSATGLTGWQQETSSAEKILCVECENYQENKGDSADRGSNLWNPVANVGVASNDYEMLPTIPGVVNTATASKLDPDNAYLEYDLAFNEGGWYDVHLRQRRGTDSTGEITHHALLRPIKTISSGTGAGGNDVITLWEDHGFVDATNGSKQIHIEGTTNGDYDGSFTISSASGDSFEIATQSAASQDHSSDRSAAPVAFGDSTLIGIFGPQTGDYSSYVSAWTAGTGYAWTHWNNTVSSDSGGERRVYIETANEYKYRIYRYQYGSRVDKLAFTFNHATTWAEVNETDLSGFGPDESTYSSTSNPSDNEYNPTQPWLPLPSATLSASTLTPENSSTEISSSTRIFATMPATSSELKMQRMWVEIGGARVQGTFSSIGNIAEFKPSTQLAANTTYSVYGSGTVRDSDGTLKSVAFGPWSFTTAASGVSGDKIMESDFSAFSSITSRQQISLDQLVNIFGDLTPDSPSMVDGIVFVSPDPDPNKVGSGKGVVLETRWPLGYCGHAFQLCLDLGTDDTYKETIWEFDYFLEPGWVCPRGWKLPAGSVTSFPFRLYDWTSDNWTASHVAATSAAAYNGYFPDNMIHSYSHERTSLYQVRPFDPVHPTQCSDSDSQIHSPHVIQMPIGKWNHVKFRARINTQGNSDGIIQAWHNDVMCLDCQTWRATTSADLFWNLTYMLCMIGGDCGDSRYANPRLQSSYFCNFQLYVDT